MSIIFKLVREVHAFTMLKEVPSFAYNAESSAKLCLCMDELNQRSFYLPKANVARGLRL